jgi:hypothetical protein
MARRSDVTGARPTDEETPIVRTAGSPVGASSAGDVRVTAQLAELRVLGDFAVSLTYVATVAGLHRYSITRMEHLGKFPTRISNRARPHYRASDVLAWLSGQWGQPAASRSFFGAHRRRA